MKKSVLFYLPKINSYLDRIITISDVDKYKINFLFIENDNKEITDILENKGHSVFFISKIIKNRYLRIIINPILIMYLTLKTQSKIIHLTSYVANPLIIKIFCIITKRKYFVSLFCLYSNRYKHFKKLSLYKKLSSPQIRRMYFFTIHEYLLLPFVDNLIMQAYGIADSLPRFKKYKHKIKVIPNAIEINNRLPQWYKKEVPIEERSLNLIYAGGIDNTRGADIVIDTFNELCYRNIDVRLTLIGEKGDNFSDKINFYEPNKVKMLSKTKREILYLEVLKNDIFIYPSKNEGSPRIILEMLAIGIPILSTTIPGIIELDKKKEFINYITNKDSIIKKIISYKSNPNYFYKKSIKGRKHIRTYNSTNYVSKMYEELYS